MLANYSVWEALEAAFWALPESADRLIVHYTPLPAAVSYDGSGDRAQWQRLKSLFGVLAERGAIADGRIPENQTGSISEEAQRHWLTLLQAESPHFHRIESVGNETERTGWIQGLRTASAEYCKIRASRAQLLAWVTRTLPSRSNVKKLATELFEAGSRVRAEECRRRKVVALANARALANSGAYLPAMINSARECLRVEIYAFADALVDAGNTYEEPLADWAETILEETALQMAGGTNSGLQGELDLHAGRTRTARLAVPGAPIEQEMREALREAKAKLSKQRIKHRNRADYFRAVPISDPPQLETVASSPHKPKRERTPSLKELMRRVEKWRMSAGNDGGKLRQDLVAGKIGFDVRAYGAAKAGKPRAKDHHGKVLKFAKDHKLL